MFLLLFSAAFAATLDVCATCTYTTVGEAVAAASSGDTVQVAAGVYDETDLAINMDLTLIGAGSDVTQLRSDSAQVLKLGHVGNPYFDTHTISVSGFDLEPSNGHGIVIDKVGVTFIDIRMDDLTSTDSGIAIYEGSPVTITDSTFEDLAGSAITHGSSYYPLTVSGSTFQRNQGRAIAAGQLNVDSCTFDQNAAGAISGRDVDSSYNRFSSNYANEGGAIWVSEDLFSSDDTFTENSAEYGGAIYAGFSYYDYSGALVSVQNGVFVGNSATSLGGDVYGVESSAIDLRETSISGSSGGSAVIKHSGLMILSGVTATGIDGSCAFYAGYEARGLGVFDSVFDAIEGDAVRGGGMTDPITIARSSFSNVNGSAVSVYSASVTVDDCTFSDDLRGISVWRDSMAIMTSAMISNSTFSGHIAPAVSGRDASISVTTCTFEDNTNSSISATGSYSLTVQDSAFEDNTDPNGGAAISASGRVIITGNRFSRNVAPFGGAINLTGTETAAVTQNWFCGNSADTGAAVALSPASSGTASVNANGNIFLGNAASLAGGDLHLEGTGYLKNNTFVAGDAPIGGSVWSDHDVELRNNIFAYTSEYALYGAGGSATIAYNDFWEAAPDAVGGTWPAPDSTNLTVDPLFVSYVEGGCEELDLGLLPESLLWDAGDPSTHDTDGTVADIGATGGTKPAEGTRRWYRDMDGDGHGVLGDMGYGTTMPSGYAATPTDCDDADADRFPGNKEDCDGVDQDCDGSVDDSPIDAPEWRTDADADGYQGPDVTYACEPPEGWGAESGPTDCDDADPTVNPGALEVCDDIDQDCDGEVGDVLWRLDADSDGYQTPDHVLDCEPPDASWRPSLGGPYDCDDADPAVFPGAEEILGDGIDQDCDDETDTAEPVAGEEGCKGCGPGANPSFALAALALALIRRQKANPKLAIPFGPTRGPSSA